MARRFTDESAIQPDASATRGADGRLLPREVGIARVSNDADFDRSAFVETVTAHLKPNRPHLMSSAADACGMDEVTFVRAVEQMTWWGMLRKKAGAELFTVGASDLAGPMHLIHTPDGACCPTGFGWRRIED